MRLFITSNVFLQNIYIKKYNYYLYTPFTQLRYIYSQKKNRVNSQFLICGYLLHFHILWQGRFWLSTVFVGKTSPFFVEFHTLLQLRYFFVEIFYQFATVSHLLLISHFHFSDTKPLNRRKIDNIIGYLEIIMKSIPSRIYKL